MPKKDKDLTVRSASAMSTWLPDSLQNVTLNDLVDSDDIEFHGGPGYLLVRRDIDGNRVMLRVDKRDHYSEISQSIVDLGASRDERDEAIQEMRDKFKMTQQEIADRTGISQSGISQILRRNRDKKK